MSWSVNKMGARAAVRAAAEADFDAYAKMYEGTEEGRDILAAKAGALSMVDALQLDPDAAAPSGYGVQLNAYGSRSQTTCMVSINVSRVGWLAS